MAVPPNDISRRTRNALAEIPTRRGMLAVHDVLPDGRRSFNNNAHNTSLNGAGPLTPGGSHPFLTPSPSPEELVIQQRGRRRIPVTFSPDIDELKKDMQVREKKEHTPVKQSSGSPGRSSIVLRSTPRKRLLLTDFSEITPEKRPSNFSKKAKVDQPQEISETHGALKILTNDQLIAVIDKLIEKHPHLQNDISALLPEPDLRPIEEHLVFLKSNIHKSIPRSRLISKTDASAYNRASTHILAFKKAVLEQGQRFLESKQWSAVIEYFMMSWKIVGSTPIWDNPSHNITRKQCFKALSAYCLTALKNGSFSPEQYIHYQSMLNTFVVDSDELQICLKYLEKMMSDQKKK